MNNNSKFSGAKRFFFTSPYLLLVFLLIPAYSVLSLRRHLPVSGDLLLGNNVLFCFCLSLRLFWYISRLRAGIRYGSELCRPSKTLELGRPVSQLQNELAGAGFTFDAGHYGEKHDLGYLGTTLLYAGLLLLLMFGSYDYMREYSIMGRFGVGEPISLDGKGLVGDFEAGSLAGTSKLPLLQIRRQILPNQQWPKGATEIALLTEDRKVLTTGTIAPGKPLNYGGLDYHMTKFVFDALIIIRRGNGIVYESFVKFLPLQANKGEFGYAGGLVNKTSGNVRGGALLNPAGNKKVRLNATTLAGEKIIETDLELWGVNTKTQGEYTAKLEGVAQWSEIRVARARHTIMLMIGAAIAIIGGFMRIAFRPQRVWLEEAGGGSLVRATGRNTMRLLGNSDKQPLK